MMSLTFGVDDLDGTIDDTTRIYSMAGAEDQKPGISTTELVAMIRSARLQTCGTGYSSTIQSESGEGLKLSQYNFIFDTAFIT
ncbi:MAG: hypothetical protein MZV63_64335 [Marinilabiliales bacterium]|nr:hypothetical protein [Marinilabiliales bacterium]